MNRNKEFSSEHLKFLRARKTNGIFITISRFSVIIIFLALWEILADLEIIDSFIMSSPSRIAKTIGELFYSGDIYRHVITTLYETLAGFIIATIVGTAFALAMWWSDNLRKIFEPYMIILNSLPKIALGPIIIVWFGSGAKSIIFMAFLITVVVTTLTMINGFCMAEENKIMLLKCMGAKKFQILTKLILPSSLPTFISCLKINVGMAWIGSIMGEYLSSKEGIGYLIVYGGHVFKLDLVMASTVILCVLAGAMYALVALLERIVVKKS